jgi:hypothetical protein
LQIHGYSLLKALKDAMVIAENSIKKSDDPIIFVCAIEGYHEVFQKNNHQKWYVFNRSILSLTLWCVMSGLMNIRIFYSKGAAYAGGKRSQINTIYLR